MDGFGATDGNQVAVALVRKDHDVGLGALNSRSYRGRSAVSGLVHVAVEVFVREHRTTDGRNADDIAFLPHFLKHLRDKAVRYAVRAARAIVKGQVCEQL
jgi:hypothetical protein